MKVKKTEGNVVPFNLGKLIKAAAFCLLEIENKQRVKKGKNEIHKNIDEIPASIIKVATQVADYVEGVLKQENTDTVSVELLHNKVEEGFIRINQPKAAIAYVSYRTRRNTEREVLKENTPTHATDIRNQQVSFPIKFIEKLLSNAAVGLDVNTQNVFNASFRNFTEDMTYVEIATKLSWGAVQHVTTDPDYDLLAGRISCYATALECYITLEKYGKLNVSLIDDMVEKPFPVIYKGKQLLRAYLEMGIEDKRINPRLKTQFDLARIEDALNPAGDLMRTFQGARTLWDRYCIKTELNERYEPTQLMFMRAAMGHVSESPHYKTNEERTDFAIELYQVYSDARGLSSTPTLFNSGTLHSQMSSCYLLDSGDSIDDIFRVRRQEALLSKWAGGIGTSMAKIRGTESVIKGTNGKSKGLISWIKGEEIDTVTVDQGGKRKGARALYNENWHIDFPRFMTLRDPNSSEEDHIEQANTVGWISDTFFKRVQDERGWSLFCPNKAKGLTDVYGKEFELLYNQYEEQLLSQEQYLYEDTMSIKSATKIKILRTTINHPMHPAVHIPKESGGAKYLYIENLLCLRSSGHPWMTFKDTCNLRSPQDHVGMVNSSNLCCMTKDQLVSTDKGIFTVEELYNEALVSKKVTGTPGSENIVREHAYNLVGRDGNLVKAGHMHMPKPNADIVEIQTKEGYTHKVTPDHKVWVENTGWIEAQNLEFGDKISLQKVAQFGTSNKPELAYIAGIIAGDGTYSVRNNLESVHIDLYSKKKELAPEIETIVKKLVEKEEKNTTSVTEPKFVGTNNIRLTSRPLTRALEKEGFTRDTKLKIPNFVWKGNKETVGNYLKGIFITDGTYTCDKEITTCSISSISLKFIQEIQILLINAGIKSSINVMRPEGETLLPNGKGGMQYYKTNESYRILITSIKACKQFAELTNCLDLKKGEQFENNIQKEGYSQKFYATFTGLVKLKKEDAYCLEVFTDEHSWIANGIVTKNTEITLNTSTTKYSNKSHEIDKVEKLGEVAVCNLASICLPKMVVKEKGVKKVSTKLLQKTVHTLVEALDNVIDVNYYPIPEAYNSNMKHRPIGLGIMGWDEMLQILEIPYESDEAVEFADTLQEHILYYTLEKSTELAKKRGAYSTFKGSKWDKGIFPIDTQKIVEENRGSKYCKFDYSSKLDWDPIRALVKEFGVRNSNHCAIAPTATIGKICGVFTAGIDKQSKNFYAEKDLLGTFAKLNPVLTKMLKAIGVWGVDIAKKLNASDGSVLSIDEIPDNIKALFKTAVETDQLWTIKQGSRRQKWIDQSQSTNLFFLFTDKVAMAKTYVAAWLYGLKTTYYCRMDSATGKEKINVKLSQDEMNKAVLRGSTALDKKEPAKETPAKVIPTPTNTETIIPSCSIDNPGCESCQ